MKYDVTYHQCESCRFIQTEQPYWLNEAYSSAITHLDIGLLSRNLYLMNEIPRLIDGLFPESKRYLDFGGGYGVFVRLMRDLGYDFYRFDTYCDNIFADFFDIKDTTVKKFDIVTSFEVFEHLEFPLEEIQKKFEFGDTIIFSTVLIPEQQQDFQKWWYVSPETGQHIAFYDKRTFDEIAKHFSCNYYSNGSNLHILTKKQLDRDKVKNAFFPKKQGLLKRLLSPEKKVPKQSLIPKDLEMIVSRLNSGKI